VTDAAGGRDVRAAPTSHASPALLGVVVVNYGSSELLRRNLGTAAALGEDVRVVVVDNASTAIERRAVAELAAQAGWDLVAMPGNPGFGTATNAGIARARELGCATFCCLNPDAVVSAEVLAALREASLADPSAVLSPRLVDSAGRTVFDGSLLALRNGRTGSRRGAVGADRGAFEEWLTGACLVVHSEMVDRTGGFAEDYFLYWEDVDLSHRVLAAGGHLVVRSDLVAVHDEGGTQGHRRGREKSPAYYRYNCRNRLLFAARNLTRRQLLAWLLHTPAASWEILLRGGRRQLLHSPRPMLAALRGTVAGTGLALVRLGGGRPARAGRPPVLVAHPGAELYGSDRVLLESVAGLAERFDVTVALPGPGPLVDELERRGVRVVLCRMPVVRKAALRPRGAGRLVADTVAGLVPALRLIVGRGAGGVYVSTLVIPLWPVLARLAGRPVVCHVHEAERSAPRLLRRALAIGPAFAQEIVVNSRFSLDTLTDASPRLRRRSSVLYNAVPGPSDVVPARARLDGTVRLLFVGRLSPRKGPQVAVAALRELLGRGLDVRLALLGSVFEGYEWFEEELVRTVREHALTDRVDFLGFEADIWPRLSEADVVLVPSTVDEPFGNTAVEAVLAGRPLVVSATSGLLEAASGYPSAQAVAAGDPVAWADAVVRVIDHWTEFRDQALQDAQEADRRHGPQTYRRRLADIVGAVAR
jgi:GT2 family glycosyltransferase